ncbi:phosphoglycerate dehydrogenase [Microbacterium sp. GXF0217]
MSRGRVLITTAYLFPDGEVDRMLRDAGFETTFSKYQDRVRTGAELTDAVADVDAIIAGTDAFTAEVIESAPRLRIFGRCGVGYDNIDVASATANGVAVTFTPGANRVSVAELVLGQMINAARMLPQNIAAVRAGGWQQRSGRELAGSTLGIIGLGSIGKTVATTAIALGMTVVAYDPFFDEAFIAMTGVRPVSLEELLTASDFVSLHIFLDSSTRDLIDRRALALMKPGSFLINTARGEVVDEEALADAIESGHLGGAALDVVRQEPLPADSRLRGFDNVIVTAHIGAATVEARSRSSLMAAKQVIALLDGDPAPEHLVNPDYLAAAGALPDRKA